MENKLKIGDSAPNFELEGNDFKKYTLDSFKNKKLIIYFYPKDNTPGCTIQATDFTKYKKDFEKIGYTIIGISLDDNKSHCHFVDKHNLEILLLSDVDKIMAKAYGAKKHGLSLFSILRSTFVLDENHKIIDLTYGVKYDGHAKELLDKYS